METIKQIRRRETPAYFTLTWLECSEACKRWCSIKKKIGLLVEKREVRLYNGEPLLPLEEKENHQPVSDWKQRLVFNQGDWVPSLGLTS